MSGSCKVEKIYAKGLTKQEYYSEWEEEHREMRNAYRRKKYRDVRSIGI